MGNVGLEGSGVSKKVVGAGEIERRGSNGAAARIEGSSENEIAG